ncbi:MAG: hypothetical protein ACR2J9_10090, partial [Gaiellales bacterium]
MHAPRPFSRISVVLVALIAFAIAIPTASAAPITVNVGAALSLTGDAAAYGLSSRKGIDMAAKEINGGALTGVKVNVKTIDD